MKTECLFAVDGKVCTRSNVCNKEACSTSTLLKGYSNCVYLYSKEKAQEYFKENK